MAEGIFKDPKMRIISGRAEVVEAEVNRLWDTYMVVTWAFAPVGDNVHVTAILIHQSEMRKMQLAMPMMGNQHR